MRNLGWCWAMVVLAVGACADEGDPGGGDGGGSDAAAELGAPADGGGVEGGGGSDVSSEPVPPARVTGGIVNDSADGLRLPSDLKLRVFVEGTPAIATLARLQGGRLVFELDGVPAGRQTLVLEELDAQSKPTWDLFQSASRRLELELASGETRTSDFHVRWHWEPRKVDGGSEVRTCQGLKQLAFRDVNEGMLVFGQEAGAGGIADPHAAAMTSSDGGLTWKVASKQLIPALFVPSAGNWFGGRPLLMLADSPTVLSLPSGGPMVRSMDGGSTWQPVTFAPPTWGPGFVEWAGLARSASALYAAVWTGGVQSSSERVSLSRSMDGGVSWQVLLDRCDRGEADQPCSNAAQPALPVGFAGNDIACGPTGHCIVVGKTTVLVTTDGFATFETFSALPTGPTCGAANTSGRAYWIPGGMTAWVVAPGSTCASAPPMRRVTRNGGKTWGDWEASPVSPGGDVGWADKDTAFALEARRVMISRDGGKSWKNTGAPPHDQNGSNDGLRLSVVDADHAWVSSAPSGGCAADPHAWVARWRP